jgi:hypothetical protein
MDLELSTLLIIQRMGRVDANIHFEGGFILQKKLAWFTSRVNLQIVSPLLAVSILCL